MTKKRIFKTIFLIGSLVSLFFVPWILVWAWILPLPHTIQTQADEAVEHGFEGIIVYVDQTGKPPAFYASGWHNRENQIPADPHALFKIASISKLYVAVAITKLVSSGRLSLDQTLADHFPELVGKIENADQITIKMMVQHRSGIPNFTSTHEYWAYPAENNTDRLELVLGLPANFEPDTDYEYSNTNYLLLREIMNSVLGYNYHQYIQEEILHPLHLTHTYGTLNEVNMNDVMSGYYVGYDLDLKTDKQGMLATAEDVGTFIRALNDGSVFNEGELEIYSSIYVYEHTGLIPGYQSIAKYNKDIDTVVIQFTNTTNFEGYHWNLSEIIYNRILKIIRS